MEDTVGRKEREKATRDRTLVPGPIASQMMKIADRLAGQSDIQHALDAVRAPKSKHGRARELRTEARQKKRKANRKAAKQARKRSRR